MKELLIPYGLEGKSIKELAGYDSLNYKIEEPNGDQWVIKHYKDPSELPLVKAEIKAIQHLSQSISFDLPFSKQYAHIHQYEDATFSRLIPFIKGDLLSQVEQNNEITRNLGHVVGSLLRGFEGYRNEHIEARKIVWDLKFCLSNVKKLKFIQDEEERKIARYFFDRFENNVLPEIDSLRFSIIHNDLNDNNIFTEGNSIRGLIDFGDMVYSPAINELAIAMTYLLFEKENLFEVASILCAACHEKFPLRPEEITLLYDLIAGRLCTSVSNSAEAKSKSTDSEYILISEKPAWNLLKKWLRINPIKFENELRKACGFPERLGEKEKLNKTRERNFPENLSLSYDDPIHMSSACFQYMHDSEGNTFLDAYNNIPHVGHCHPKISKVISEQSRRLNTNTRYHFDLLAEYSSKLLSYFPSSLDKLFLVNSGSAASDLALRLAMNFTQSNHILVMEHGYHGNSQLGIDVSSYKFDGKGGFGKSENIHVLPLAKEFNGKTGAEYANAAITQIENLMQEGIQPACFIAEPVSGCGGQVPLAPGYLSKLIPFLKEKGILYISDEVQVGFGRLGSHFWGFEAHNVLPDLVILGKPIGNGHPMAAVVSTNEIAHKVAHKDSMEFFSSFGGNPVSCAVGLEVLNILEVEELQKNSLEVGSFWIDELKKIQEQFPTIGDVRGMGLFIGLEMVHEDGLSPNTELAKKIKNQMRENFILCSTDGPFNNVIKCKPPLCFTKENASEFSKMLMKLLEA